MIAGLGHHESSLVAHSRLRSDASKLARTPRQLAHHKLNRTELSTRLLKNSSTVTQPTQSSQRYGQCSFIFLGLEEHSCDEFASLSQHAAVTDASYSRNRSCRRLRATADSQLQRRTRFRMSTCAALPPIQIVPAPAAKPVATAPLPAAGRGQQVRPRALQQRRIAFQA